MPEILRQQIHLTSFYGKMVSPCGLCRLGDVYHIFYECLPDKGKMQWGHFSTNDFCEFKEHRPFISPDTKFDTDGVFGGSALVEKGKPIFFYTGNASDTQNILSARPNEERGAEKALMLQKEDYPADIAGQVSSPFVYKNSSGYNMILGAQTKDGEGCAVVYTAPDAARWKYSHQIVSHTPLGYMWENPCSFKIESMRFLIFCAEGAVSSPQESPHTAAWANLSENLIKDCHSLDFGFDFYAPQIFANNQGEILMIGSMTIPESPYGDSAPLPCCLSLPRVISLKNDMLYQSPSPFLKELRTEKRTLSLRSGETGDTFGAVFEMELSFTEERFAFLLRENIRVECNEGNFIVTMGKSGLGRTQKEFYAGDFKNVHIFSDRASVEMFIGGKSFSTRLSDKQKGTVSILLGNCRAQIYKLNSIKFQ